MGAGGAGAFPGKIHHCPARAWPSPSPAPGSGMHQGALRAREWPWSSSQGTPDLLLLIIGVPQSPPSPPQAPFPPPRSIRASPLSPHPPHIQLIPSYLRDLRVWIEGLGTGTHGAAQPFSSSFQSCSISHCSRIFQCHSAVCSWHNSRFLQRCPGHENKPLPQPQL